MGERGGKKEEGVREERKKMKGKGPKENRGKRGKREEKLVGGQREKKREGGRWVQGVRGAWVLRRVGPHTNNAGSTFFHKFCLWRIFLIRKSGLQCIFP